MYSCMFTYVVQCIYQPSIILTSERWNRHKQKDVFESYELLCIFGGNQYIIERQYVRWEQSRLNQIRNDSHQFFHGGATPLGSRETATPSNYGILFRLNEADHLSLNKIYN